jgi:hypothetical protein
MEDKLKKYIREYIMSLYKIKMNDGSKDYSYKYTSDVEHPIQQRDIAKPKIPPAFIRNRSTAKPHFENKK